MIPDKRKHPRLSVHLPATYSSKNISIQAYISNISQQGLFISCSAVDRVGTTAQIKLRLPGDAQPLDLSGMVVWNTQAVQLCGMGLCLTNLTRDSRIALANFLISKIYSD